MKVLFQVTTLTFLTALLTGCPEGGVSNRAADSNSTSTTPAKQEVTSTEDDTSSESVGIAAIPTAEELKELIVPAEDGVSLQEANGKAIPPNQFIVAIAAGVSQESECNKTEANEVVKAGEINTVGLTPNSEYNLTFCFSNEESQNSSTEVLGNVTMATLAEQPMLISATSDKSNEIAFVSYLAANPIDTEYAIKVKTSDEQVSWVDFENRTLSEEKKWFRFDGKMVASSKSELGNVFSIDFIADVSQYLFQIKARNIKGVETKASLPVSAADSALESVLLSSVDEINKSLKNKEAKLNPLELAKLNLKNSKSELKSSRASLKALKQDYRGQRKNFKKAKKDYNKLARLAKKQEKQIKRLKRKAKKKKVAPEKIMTLQNSLNSTNEKVRKAKADLDSETSKLNKFKESIAQKNTEVRTYKKIFKQQKRIVAKLRKSNKKARRKKVAH